jgi:predicted PhzF superfamily epimerase YddE/YHI9
VATARLFQVDTFTDRPFAGNPAGVCLLETERATEWLQAIATELRMPATAFAIPQDDGWKLRWFTVTNELEICGHGTVAAAHVLWDTAALDPADIASFVTASGPITASRVDKSIFLTLRPGRVEEVEAPPSLRDAVPTSFQSVWRTPLDYLLVLESPSEVTQLEPVMDAVAAVNTRGVIITAEGGDSVDFTSRFFAPSIGLPEDSVTGSAHASLAPFWATRLGKTALRARQASERGGYLDLRVFDDTVQVGGPAVTVSRGELVV